SPTPTPSPGPSPTPTATPTPATHRIFLPWVGRGMHREAAPSHPAERLGGAMSPFSGERR
ncbi:MAG: hypothetical protein ACP5OO_10920, partial [Chloroflexia bacterium]